MPTPTEDKRTLRARHTEFRRRLRHDPARKASLDAAILTNAVACIDAFGARGANISAYNPLPTEPGPADFAAQLRRHARSVFIPISLPDGVLAWSLADGATQPGALGVAEPTGARFTSRVLSSCALLLVPALAVDARGMRLGKGAGYYDRALAGLDVPTAAVLYDEEVVDTVPHDAHDVPVHAIITPRGWREISV
ncbi:MULTISPECIES: 5-formyltetrahydrofolate cyclo-ligase [Corynebacterium]|uniref:5-formyltetrahydrofolate cyclo-ligase n=1 Tax=Corynebacterium hadale TaxID=2026255 RepID=A0A269PDA5_9CORY|nr:5-formyltetrahydrofolate cyclo-ligase [Corynebacterium hadale]PAJ70026.1 5-formyltetrahydrofolate cyclo-ligase [Corynebacterium hadale]WKC59653.1 5-formyltetrahydrofolate cyclo-ligase family protein [Corynebacterium hadale]